MAIVRWTRHAANDLQSVYRRIALDSAVNAEKMLRRIEAKADQLARYPGMGRPGRVPGTRELVVHHHYFIVYRPVGSTV